MNVWNDLGKYQVRFCPLALARALWLDYVDKTHSLKLAYDLSGGVLFKNARKSHFAQLTTTIRTD